MYKETGSADGLRPPRFRRFFQYIVESNISRNTIVELA